VTMKIQCALAVATLGVVSALGCGGRASGRPESGASASCEPTLVDAGEPLTADARVVLNHRPSACCTSQRGPGGADQPYPPGVAAFSADGGVACSSDSQCASGTNGRCFPFEGLVGPGGCSYDDCSSDSDCPSGTPCLCRASASDNAANICAPGGNCAVDSDCGPGGFCSPSRQNCAGPTPYFCHTASDACVNDADCPPSAADNPAVTRDVCAYDPQASHWACKQLVCYPP
jgi:hypothetical protein